MESQLLPMISEIMMPVREVHSVSTLKVYAVSLQKVETV